MIELPTIKFNRGAPSERIGADASQRSQPVLYVTERCVLQLTPKGLELIEIAPGIDLQNDVLDRMGFVPRMDAPPAVMSSSLFRDDFGQE